MMGYFNVFLYIAIVSAAFGCKYIEYGADHVMCKYEENKCNPRPRGLTTFERDKMLRMLNEKRQLVASGRQPGQPSATNMKQLVWDEELAQIAQRLTDQCDFTTNKNRRSKKYEYVGLNEFMFRVTNPEKNIKVVNVISSWFNDVSAFNRADISPFKLKGGSSSYTQMVWAETEAVGCGYAYFHKGLMNMKYVTCLFGPGGNIVNGELYKSGSPCRDCPNGCSNQYSALCSTNQQFQTMIM